MNVPKGTTPVVMTFDDSTKEQFFYDARGRIKPDTAIGIMLAFQRTHPDFKLAGTFYVNREPFAGVRQGPAMLRWLVAHGFEIGDHTYDHIPFNQLDATGVQRELVKGQQVITRAVPGAKVETMALPLGVMPKPASLALSGRWGGESYHFGGVFLVGANPAPSPFSSKFDRAAIPRIRAAPWVGKDDFAWGYWQRILARQPSLRYVSDGDPKTISFPRRLESSLAPGFRSRAKPY
jgi:Polysaccharide deacetylase